MNSFFFNNNLNIASLAQNQSTRRTNDNAILETVLQKRLLQSLESTIAAPKLQKKTKLEVPMPLYSNSQVESPNQANSNTNNLLEKLLLAAALRNNQ